MYHSQLCSPEVLVKAKLFFVQALPHDPNYAPAYGGLAQHYFTFAGLNIKPLTEMAPLAKSAAEKALAIDSSLNDAHAILGGVAASFEYNWRAAERQFQMATAVEPIPALARYSYANYFLVPLEIGRAHV